MSGQVGNETSEPQNIQPANQASDLAHSRPGKLELPSFIVGHPLILIGLLHTHGLVKDMCGFAAHHNSKCCAAMSSQFCWDGRGPRSRAAQAHMCTAYDVYSILLYASLLLQWSGRSHASHLPATNPTRAACLAFAANDNVARRQYDRPRPAQVLAGVGHRHKDAPARYLKAG